MNGELIERFYLRLYDRLLLRPRSALILAGLAVAISLAVLPWMQLDMSFRPLFADEDEAAPQTAEFQPTFGRYAGAYIGVIVEAEGVLTRPVLARLAAVSDAVAALDHVTEVQSLTRLAFPVWASGEARWAWLADPAALRSSEGIPDSLIQAIRQDGRLRRTLLSEDGRKTLLLARVDLPLQDLEGRTKVIRAFRSQVTSSLDGAATLHFVGVSVVEEAYARIVLASLARSFALTSIALMLLLWLIYRRVASVVAAMAGVGLAVPVSLALITVVGQDLTMVNSMLPVMIMVIGVADAIHMLESFYVNWEHSGNRSHAVRKMFGEMGLPCLLTALTTAFGFLCLRTANIGAIRDFGLVGAIGIVAVYGMNVILVPVLLRSFPERRLRRRASASAWLDAWTRQSSSFVVRRSRWVLGGTFAVALFCLASLPALQVDQYFNKEIAAEHPVRTAQALLENDFTGILGPEISLRRKDGASLVTAETRQRVAAFMAAVCRFPEVLACRNFLDVWPPGVSPADARKGLDALRNDPVLGMRVRELINDDASQAAIVIRTTDMGTSRAHAFADDLRALAAVHLGGEYEVEIVGQWWLAQRGMQNITRDMLASFSTSCLSILPVLALVLWNGRLFLTSILPNVLPTLFALAFSVWMGIPLRIGTAMILAIALGIAVDDTIHFLVRLKAEEAAHRDPRIAVTAALRRAGSGILYSSAVLVAGFLSMLSNDLLAIRDMGVVAAATLAVAMLAEVYLAPALYLALSRKLVAVPTPAA